MMITEGAGELNPAVRATAAVLSRPATIAARTMIPIILTVTEQEATPLTSVVAAHDCVPFRVSVTGSFGTGWFV